LAKSKRAYAPRDSKRFLQHAPLSVVVTACHCLPADKVKTMKVRCSPRAETSCNRTQTWQKASAHTPQETPKGSCSTHLFPPSPPLALSHSHLPSETQSLKREIQE
jgi:hypothetical protein